MGIFPNPAAVLRLFTALLAEQTDEWLLERHYFSQTTMRAVLLPPDDSPSLPESAVA